ncbi:MAG: hypothetical protein ACLSW4_04995 [Clostridia bacterium]|jgi:hypothetical protein|nr:hypothetical protein [Clostridium sp.]HJJ12282.1 hypothetical protein [Clostridiaceae bacterium]
MIQTDKVTYKMAYTQVLEILKRLPKEEVAKIPTEEIEFLKENCDKTYKYILSPNARLEECQISRKAYAILVVYFKKYFATEIQKQKLDVILKNNQIAIEKEKREKYGVDNLFKENKLEQEENKKVEIVPYKESFFKRVLNRIKKIFRR